MIIIEEVSCAALSVRQEGNSAKRRTAIIAVWTLPTSAAWDVTSQPSDRPRPGCCGADCGIRGPPLVRRNESSTCLWEECHGPDGPEIPPGSWGIWAPVKSPLVFKCIFRRVDWRTGRCLICLPCHVKESLSSTDHLPWGFTHLLGV